jgi:peptidoglycan/xylan/chitin deacetylase (PgdA/CDA1 family)
VLEFSFDDGCAEDMRIYHLLKKYGFKNATFYIPSEWTEYNKHEGRVPLSIDQLLEISDSFRIGSHTATHEMLTRLPKQDIFIELKQSKDTLESLLGEEVTHFCYPKGYANDEIREMVREHYKIARNVGVNNLDFPDDPIWTTPTVHVAGNKRKEYEGTHWLAEARKLLSAAKQRLEFGTDYYFHVWGHSHEISKFNEWDNFEIFLQELRNA